jgi:hypothetical protein
VAHVPVSIRQADQEAPLKIRRLLSLAVLAAVASSAALALPSVAAAKYDKVVNCSFKDVPGTRTARVNATIKARDLENSTRFVAKCKTAGRLVRGAVAKSPTRKRFVNSGFGCTPKWLSSGGLDIRWKCIYKGADNPSYSLIAFTLHLHS